MKNYDPNNPYKVMCLSDTNLDGTRGEYVLATQKNFATAEKALWYAKGISPSREPIIIGIVREVGRPEGEGWERRGRGEWERTVKDTTNPCPRCGGADFIESTYSYPYCVNCKST